MDLQIAPLLFLVIDPFGNLPFILAILRKLPPRGCRIFSASAGFPPWKNSWACCSTWWR